MESQYNTKDKIDSKADSKLGDPIMGSLILLFLRAVCHAYPVYMLPWQVMEDLQDSDIP